MLPRELTVWRKAERERLIAARRAIPSAERERVTAAIVTRLDAELAQLPLTRVALYWPLFGEIDLRGWAKAAAAERGLAFALPVVTEKNAPLEFWRWRPGDAMTKGFWNIPVPAARNPVTPDAVLAPLVGFDGNCYRLGYGGGYFDRTLAAMKAAGTAPVAIGIGLELQRLDSIRPEPHDIPMHCIITESGVQRRRTGQTGG